MKIISLAVATGLILMLGLSHSTLGSVIQKKSFEDLAIQADLAAIGRVLNVESHPTMDGQYAYTYVTVGELELLKGTYRQPTITLRMDGGPLADGSVLLIPGIPSFEPGEKVVVFVRGNGQHICPLIGWEQGLLRVVKDPRSGQEILRTSEGKRIHTIEQGEFVIGSTLSREEADNSAGQPDYGQVKDLRRLEEILTSADLTLDSLKAQVRTVLAKAGLKARPRAEVRSAELTLESPMNRTNKQPKRRN